MLSCPDCNHELTTTRIETGAPGGTIDVDRCANCGGVWFDHFEINRLPTHEAVRLSNLPTHTLPNPLTSPGKCPHCGIALTRLVATSVPPDSRVLHCSLCRGNWVSKKELVKVKSTQDSKLGRLKILGVPLPSLSAILIPLLIVVFLAGSVPVTLNLLKRANETRIRARELIATPTIIPVETEGLSRSVVLTFTSTIPVRSQIALKSPQVTSIRILPISTTAKLLHVLRITDLSPKTSYDYTIKTWDENGVETQSETYTFTTL